MLDVDGTLMRRAAFNPGARELIDLLLGRGVTVALCSGRPPESMINLAGMFPGISLLSASSGSTVLARSDRGWQVLAHRRLDPGLVTQTIRATEAAGIETWGYTASQWLVPRETPRVLEETSFVQAHPHIDPIVGRTDIGKILLLLQRAEHRDVVDELAREAGARVVLSAHNYADLVPEVSARAKGGDVLLDHLGLGWDSVLAVGDGENDIGMLSSAGWAVTVAPLRVSGLPAAGSHQLRCEAADTNAALHVIRGRMGSGRRR